MKSFTLFVVAVALFRLGSAFSQSDDNPFGESPVGQAAKKMKSDAGPQVEFTASVSAATAQGEDDDAPLLLKTYDVNDIVAFTMCDYPARRLNDLGDGRALLGEPEEPLDMTMPPMYSNTPHPGSHAPPKTRSDNRYDDLEMLITAIVSPPQWDRSGGRSNLSFFGGVMVVSAPKADHEQIGSLLDQIRKHLASRRTVLVETHWLWLTEEQLHALAPNSSGVVEEKAWEEHQKQLAKEDSELMPGYHAAISCLNGQTVSTVAGRRRRFLITIIPVVGDTGGAENIVPSMPVNFGGNSSRAVGYQPQSSTLQEGAALQIRPILCGEDEVILDIHGRVVEVETPDPSQDTPTDRPKPAATQPGGEYASDIRDVAAVIDRPVVQTSRIDTTVRASLNSQVLVGGITGSSPTSPDEPFLYLFAKITVQKSPKEGTKGK